MLWCENTYVKVLLKLKWGPKSQQEEEEELREHERREKGFVNFDMGGLRRLRFRICGQKCSGVATPRNL